MSHDAQFDADVQFLQPMFNEIQSLHIPYKMLL